jgi:alginate export protein
MRRNSFITWALPAIVFVSILNKGLAGQSMEMLQKPILEEKSWEPGDPISFYDGKLVWDVQERLRFEWRENNFDFNDTVNALNDDAYLLQRFRIGVKGKPNDWITGYLQTQDSREVDSERPDDPAFFGSEGTDTFFLRQANVTIANYKECPLGATIGRQELVYGDERLIGNFDWNNIGRVFDGVKLRFQQEKWNVESFAVMPVEHFPDHFDRPDTQDKFFGVYFQTSTIPKQVTELYAFYRMKSDFDSGFPMGGSTIGTDVVAPGGVVLGTQKGDYVTLGTRIKSTPGQLGPWDYEMETAGQLGSIVSNSVDTNVPNATSGRKDLATFATHVAGGYTLEGEEKARFGLEYNFASGDHDPADNDNGSFQNLFPTNHKFYGYMDVFAWRNMHNARAQFNITPVEKLVVQLDYHAFWLADTSDQWFRANAYTPVRNVSARTLADNFCGHEVDVTVTYPFFKWMRTLVGYSHFFAGPYLADTGKADDADFAYIQVVFQL